jgi:small basic protein (TIGR04137 family)
MIPGPQVRVDPRARLKNPERNSRYDMSLDRSLKSANALVRHRNVLTRPERLAKLSDDGKWDEKKSVFGLPKVAHRKVEAVKAVKEAAAEGAEGAAAAGGAAPAAGAAAPAAKGAAPAAKGAAPAAGAKGAAPAAGAKAAAPAAKKK